MKWNSHRAADPTKGCSRGGLWKPIQTKLSDNLFIFRVLGMQSNAMQCNATLGLKRRVGAEKCKMFYSLAALQSANHKITSHCDNNHYCCSYKLSLNRTNSSSGDALSWMNFCMNRTQLDFLDCNIHCSKVIFTKFNVSLANTKLFSLYECNIAFSNTYKG